MFERPRFTRFSLIAPAAVVLAAVMLLAITQPAAAAELYYTYRTADRGGVGVMQIDSHTGAILGTRKLYESQDTLYIDKLALSQSGKLLAAINVQKPDKDKPAGVQLILLHLDESNAPAGALPKAFPGALPGEPGEIDAFGERFLVGQDKGWDCVIDGPTGRIISEWNARKQLDPPGHHTEDFWIQPDGKLAWATLQKDSSSGKYQGSRLVLFELPELKVRHDLLLPRNHPELHLANNAKESGPNPEVILVSPATNTLMLSLDLYGGVALADLDAARNGNWANLLYLSTAPDGAWGVAFPDRMTMFHFNNRDYVLISNAGQPGGAAIVDLADRRIVQCVPCDPGLDTPTYLPLLKSVVAVKVGKLKGRDAEGLTKTYEPGRGLYLFDVAPLAAGGEVALRIVETPGLCFRLDALEPEANNLVAVATGEKQADHFTIFDAATGRIIATEPAFGDIQRTLLRRDDSR